MKGPLFDGQTLKQKGEGGWLSGSRVERSPGFCHELDVGSSHPPGYLLVWERCMHAGKMMMRSAYRLLVDVLRKGLEGDEERNTKRRRVSFFHLKDFTDGVRDHSSMRGSIVVPASVQRHSSHPCRLLHHFPRHPGTTRHPRPTSAISPTDR